MEKSNRRTMSAGALCLMVCLLSASPVLPCSIFAANDGPLVLASNNEDWVAGEYDTGIWFVPPADGNYGFAVFGYTTFEGQQGFSAQGGVNSQGLFLDANAAPLLEAKTNPDGKRGLGWDLFAGPLEHCATVQEALDFYATYNLTGIIERAKIFIADRHGDAAIFEGDWTTHKTGAYLISTNFYESHPELGGFPCARYAGIEELLTNGTPLSMDFMVQAAKSASRDGTYFTNVHDLPANTFRLYYRHDYSRYLNFDLAYELSGSGGVMFMADLFGPKLSDERGEIVFHPPAYRLPSQISLRLRDTGPNLSPALRDQVQVTVRSLTGDEETINLTEIRPDLGVFAGSLPAEFGAVVPGDGRLQSMADDRIQAQYHDLNHEDGNPADIQAEALIFCDLDQDGHDDQACGGPDCHDLLPDFNPDATEFCDSQDDNCNGQTDETCTACQVPSEPDITKTALALNPLSCGACFEGNFDETHYGDEGLYRLWADAYQFEAEAGQTIATSAYRPAPNGILTQVWFNPAGEEVASDPGYGSFIHTFAEAGAHSLALVLQRADPSMAPNTYRLELHCLPEQVPDTDGGVDAGVDGGAEADGGTQNPDQDQEPNDSGCACGNPTGAPPLASSLLWCLLALFLLKRE